MKSLLVAFVVIMSVDLGFCQDRPTWRGIVPLQSQKKDVDSVVKGLRLNDRGQYGAENENVSVVYASERCVGNGWDVQAGTVLEYTVYLLRHEKIEKLADPQKLILIVDDVLSYFYTDEKNGVQYLADRENTVFGIRYTPAAHDSRFRCKGFPAYSAAAEQYQPYDVYKLRGNKQDAYSTAGTLSELMTYPEHRGYIFVYLKVGSPDRLRVAALSRIKKFVEGTTNGVASRVTVAFGGYRDKSEVETFVLFRADLPPPRPSPKYPVK